MNKILSLLLLLSVVRATTTSLCALKRDASYTGFAQCSNDMEAYETFFKEAFSECAVPMTVYDLPGIDTKTSCHLKRKGAYIGFTYLSNDMKLFEQIFQGKHPECAVEDIVTSQGYSIDKRSARRINPGNINTNIDNAQITNKKKAITPTL